jgi:UrcA family protein
MNTSNRSRTSALFALLACVSALGTQPALADPAHAGDHPVTIKIRVSTAGLDASQPEGARELYGRMAHAAEIACGHGNRVDLRPLDVYAYPRCYEHGIAAAVRSANLPELTRVYFANHPSQEEAARRVASVAAAQ